MPSPLNPTLYGRLREEFGRVLVSHAGIAASKQYAAGILDGRMQMRLTSAGEYYRVNCPFCGDGRGRLWVNHLFGVPDEVTGRKNLGLAICFNEDCIAAPGRAYELYDRLYGFRNAGMRNAGPIVILSGEVEEQTLKEVSPPGITLRFDRMPETDKACKYLLNRGLNPKELGQVFGVSYCLEASPNYPMAQGRIVFPIVMRDMLVGWQCRYVGDLNWKAAGIPKYYSLPNMPRRLMLYNFDVARKQPFVVVTEGPLDVIGVGEPAVATFGKKLSAPQVQLICECWEGGAVIILLDGDAWDDAQELAERFRQEQYKGAVIPVRLPIDTDPGSLARSFLWECIDDECRRVGVDLLAIQREERHDEVRQCRHPYRCTRRDGAGRNVSSQQAIPEYTFDSPRNAATGAELHQEGD